MTYYFFIPFPREASIPYTGLQYTCIVFDGRDIKASQAPKRTDPISLVSVFCVEGQKTEILRPHYALMLMPGSGPLFHPVWFFHPPAGVVIAYFLRKWPRSGDHTVRAPCWGRAVNQWPNQVPWLISSARTFPLFQVLSLWRGSLREERRANSLARPADLFPSGPFTPPAPFPCTL